MSSVFSFDLFSNFDSHEHGPRVYRDASRCVLGEACVVVAVVVFDVHNTFIHFGKFRPLRHVSVFHSELYAIYRSLSFLRCFKGRRVLHILPYCFSALQILRKSIELSHWCGTLKKYLLLSWNCIGSIFLGQRSFCSCGKRN